MVSRPLWSRITWHHCISVIPLLRLRSRYTRVDAHRMKGMPQRWGRYVCAICIALKAKRGDECAMHACAEGWLASWEGADPSCSCRLCSLRARAPLPFGHATAVPTKALRTWCRKTLCLGPTSGVPGGKRHLRLPARLRPHGLRRASAPVYAVHGSCARAAAPDAAGRSLVHASLPLEAWWITLSGRPDGACGPNTLFHRGVCPVFDARGAATYTTTRAPLERKSAPGAVPPPDQRESIIHTLQHQTKLMARCRKAHPRTKQSAARSERHSSRPSTCGGAQVERRRTPPLAQPRCRRAPPRPRLRS